MTKSPDDYICENCDNEDQGQFGKIKGKMTCANCGWPDAVITRRESEEVDRRLAELFDRKGLFKNYTRKRNN